jgi:hypothetical protein
MVNTTVHMLRVDLTPLREMDTFWSVLVRQLGG